MNIVNTYDIVMEKDDVPIFLAEGTSLQHLHLSDFTMSLDEVIESSHKDKDKEPWIVRGKTKRSKKQNSKKEDKAIKSSERAKASEGDEVMTGDTKHRWILIDEVSGASEMTIQPRCESIEEEKGVENAWMISLEQAEPFPYIEKEKSSRRKPRKNTKIDESMSEDAKHRWTLDETCLPSVPIDISGIYPLPLPTKDIKKPNPRQKKKEKEMNDSAVVITEDSLSSCRKKTAYSKYEKKFSKAQNESQEKYLQLLNDPIKKIIFTIGPAGTGKTMFATEIGIKGFLNKQYEKLIFTRPTVSVDEDIGFLPGTLEEKLAPWVRPIFDILYEFLTPREVQSFVEDKVFEIAPIGYLRGRTLKNAFIIADEMQNCTVNQMKMLLTRIGQNSRMVITGDLEQNDLLKINGLSDFLQRFQMKNYTSNAIAVMKFEHSNILREPVIKEILDIYG